MTAAHRFSTRGVLAPLAGLALMGTLAACGTASALPPVHPHPLAKSTANTHTPTASQDSSTSTGSTTGSSTGGPPTGSPTGSSTASSTGSSTGASGGSVGSTGGSAGSSSGSSPAGTTLARCASSGLAVTLVQSQGAAGSRIRTYAFTNQTAANCTLYGYPGFQLLGESGQALATHVTWTPGSQTLVVLPPGGHAWFTMQYAAATGYGTLTCPTSSELEVTPPNAYHSITVSGRAGTIQAFGGATVDLQCGRISVEPVTSVPPAS